MKNLTPFENFGQEPVQESMNEMGSCMSESAKEDMKSLCEGMLCGEAQAYHDDADEAHTYEDYVEKCCGCLREMMGQPGYQSLTKTYAE